MQQQFDRHTYRGKALCDENVKIGEWVYGGLFKTKDGCWIVRLMPGECCAGIIQHIRVDPATVGQCTGLRDKNGAWNTRAGRTCRMIYSTYTLRNGKEVTCGKCSACGLQAGEEYTSAYLFCPGCGARIEKEGAP